MNEKSLSDMTPEELAGLSTAELVARMGAAARQVGENAAACSSAAAEAIEHADRAIELAAEPDLARFGASVVACRDCGALFGVRSFLAARCPRCGELEVIEAGRVA